MVVRRDRSCRLVFHISIVYKEDWISVVVLFAGQSPRERGLIIYIHLVDNYENLASPLAINWYIDPITAGKPPQCITGSVCWLAIFGASCDLVQSSQAIRIVQYFWSKAINCDSRELIFETLEMSPAMVVQWSTHHTSL